MASFEVDTAEVAAAGQRISRVGTALGFVRAGLALRIAGEALPGGTTAQVAPGAAAAASASCKVVGEAIEALGLAYQAAASNYEHADEQATAK